MVNATSNAPASDADGYLVQMRIKRLYGGALMAVFAALMVSGYQLADSRNAGGFWDGIGRVFDFPAEVVREAVTKITELPARMWDALPSLVETLNIAGASTLAGAIIAVVLSLLSTRGLARWPRLIPVFRRTMDLMRAFPEIVIALILIYLLGGGPVPAMIAIAFHTAGALGKLFSEVAENADLKPVEGLTSVGATWLQRMWLGVLPQVAPNWISYALLRFEINIRASAILGFVGSGGIGSELKTALQWGQGRYDEVIAIFIVLFLSIVAVDQISSIVRSRLVKGTLL
jgi:phosphonate transport system permease protein